MTRRQRHRRRQQQSSGSWRRVTLLGVSVVITGVVIAVLAVIGYIVGIAASAPSIDSLKPIDKGATSVVYADDGQRLGFIQYDQLRTPISDADIPRYLRQATVAIEDQRFYHHKGVDYEGVVRAAFKNISSGKTVQGGSTITMQLVRNLYISQERTFRRKIREAKLAEELEKEHSKEWILSSYLNDVSYGTVGGQTAVGIQAAARIFFDKPAKDLTLAEAALLAGLPQAPSVYNPFRDPRGALLRRNEVLRKMAKLRMITPLQAARTAAQPLSVHANRYYQERRESYFFDYVKQELVDHYGANTVRRGGLKIYTTVKLGLQKAARAAMRNTLPYTSDPSSAMVSIDPRNGYIRAMASKSKYGKTKFNYAAQGHRQPGSTFKVMVLMAALREGISPESTTYVSHPLDLVTKYGPWKVQTYSHSYGGSMNLVQATLKSDNTIYAQLDLDVGPEKVREAAYDMGIKTHLDGLPAEGLGGLKIGVSPLEMADAYATIASGGYRNTPIAIKRVVFPDGHVDADIGKPHRVRAFSEAVAAEATKILQMNVQQGTGTAASIGCPAAGKTGTTDDFTDAWFDGFTPKLVTAVWVGYPNARVSMRSVHGIQVAGGTFPAQIWHTYMTAAHGSDCSGFNLSGAGGGLSPYFGRYSQTGSRGGGYGYGTNGNGNGGGSTGTGGYNPKYYESPPQTVPQTTTPAKEPSSGAGGKPGHGGGGAGTNSGGGVGAPGGTTGTGTGTGATP